MPKYRGNYLTSGLQPREFYLGSTFQIEKQLQHPDGHTVLEGPGWPLLPPRALTGKAFHAFQAACANFIGFRDITDLPYTRHLLQYAQEHREACPADYSTMEKALTRLIHSTRSPAIKSQLQQYLAGQRAGSPVTSPAELEQRPPEYALSVRQPHAEAILRGIKTVEYRSFPTRRRGRVYIYASRIPVENISSCMKEYGMEQESYEDLPRGVLVGTVEVFDSREGEWYLRNPKRAEKLLKPKHRPQPVWFRPF
ncbi:MAG TPA: ASCH domain-containing protein [Gemmatales bacterium]|nr:ASCH domain-containing protein [Gemmatales bacterium]